MNNTNYQGYGLPERLTLAYQRIPPRIRSFWSMGSSSSGLALEAIRDSHRGARHWAAFGTHMAGIKFLPGYAAGAAIRHAGLAVLVGSVLDPGGGGKPWFINGRVRMDRQDNWFGPVTGLHGPDGAWHHSAGLGAGVKVPWDNPPMPKSSLDTPGFWAPHMGLENKELPDWFPTTHISASWWEVQPTGLFTALGIGFAGGLCGPRTEQGVKQAQWLPFLVALRVLVALRQPPGYPANPPPSLNWNGPKKK